MFLCSPSHLQIFAFSHELPNLHIRSIYSLMSQWNVESVPSDMITRMYLSLRDRCDVNNVYLPGSRAWIRETIGHPNMTHEPWNLKFLWWRLWRLLSSVIMMPYGNMPAFCRNLPPAPPVLLTYCFTLKMEAVCSLWTLHNFQPTTQLHGGTR
jgi:hypothetical protein